MYPHVSHFKNAKKGFLKENKFKKIKPFLAFSKNDFIRFQETQKKTPIFG